MIKEHFYIEDWEIELFIIVENYDVNYIINELISLNCNKNQIKQAYKIIEYIKNNVGFTFTNYLMKKSIIMIGKLSNKQQLINTISHESRHLLLHIANYYDLDLNSELVCYLIGNIVQIIYSILEKHQLI